jgi:hypothetical protein
VCHPAPPPELRRWLSGDPDDAQREPELIDRLPADAATTGTFITGLIESDGFVSVETNPGVQACFDEWIRQWRPWAEQERVDEPARSLYGRLFATRVNLTAHPEEFELIVATGCLAWRPRDAEPARRHLLTSPAATQFDEDTGDLAVALVAASDVISVELDMLDPQLLTDPQRINAVKAEAREFTAHPMNRDEAGALARRLVHTLARHRPKDTTIGLAHCNRRSRQPSWAWPESGPVRTITGGSGPSTGTTATATDAALASAACRPASSRWPRCDHCANAWVMLIVVIALTPSRIFAG